MENKAIAYIHYKHLSEERQKLRQLWNNLHPIHKLDWEDFVKTAELLKQSFVI